MGSRTNVSAVRSMQMDRGTRIRTFRKMKHARDVMEGTKKTGNKNCAAFFDPMQSRDLSPPNDTNGERYAQALDRLTSFKSRLKKRIWQDHRKIEWREENVHLQRASQELTKAIQDMLESFAWKGCGTMAPAWGDSGSTGQKSECALGDQQATVGASSSPKGVDDFGAEAQKLEAIRLADLHADVSHIQEVRALVAEFVGKGRGKRQTASSLLPRHPSQLTSKDPILSQHESCTVSCASTAATQSRQKDCFQAAIIENAAASEGNTISSLLAPRTTDESRTAGLGSQAAVVAQLLVQARTEHNKAGSYLVETVRTLEAEAEDSRKAVAAVLALDRTDVYSSTQTWVLDKIGMGTRVGNAPTGNDSHRKVECAKAGGLRATEEVFERVGAVQEEVTLAEVSHRLGMLEAKHDARLAALRDEFLREAAGPTAAGSVEAALDKNGGWAAERHFRFMKVMKAYAGTGSGMIIVGGLGGPDGKSTLTKRLTDELTGVSSAEISRHESWHRLRGMHVAKKRAEKQAHARDLDELVAWGKNALDELQHEAERSAARADEQKERDRRRAELDELLGKQREERELRNRLAREQKQQALLQKLCRETEEAARKAEEDERKRDALAEYRASLEELRGREAEVREAAAKAAEAERLERMPKNRARVGFREERAREKREEIERRDQEAKAIEANRMQVLEKLAASVPYAEACANAEAKLDHVTAATAAHFDQFLPFERSRGHCPMFGYNTGKVLKDARFRLGLYLREAGLSGSAAAHAAVMKAAGPRRDAPY